MAYSSKESKILAHGYTLIPKPDNFAWSEIDWHPTNLVSIQNKNHKNFNAYGVDGCHPGYHIHKNFAEFVLLLLKKTK